MMIQQKLLIIVLCSALLLIGCNKKPKPNSTGAMGSNIEGATQIAGDTISIDENGYAQNANGSTTINGKHNSSSDGFQSIYFGFGQYGISADMENDMSTNVNVARKSHKKIKLEGNCDEFGTDEYNYALGLKRAKAVKDTLVSQGVASQSISMISFGESNPVCSNPTDDCYAQNRRVDLRLIK